MLGDVLLLEPGHEAAASEILNTVMGRKDERLVIAISGESGSGKSELAHALAKLLKQKGITAKPLHSDNYYLTHPLERTAWRTLHGRDNIGLNEYDWNKIHKNIRDFKEGRKSEMPCVDILTDQVDILITDFSSVEMLILDGLYAIHSEMADIRIFIDLTYHETKKAQLRRGKEPQNEFRTMVLEREHEVVQSLKPLADLIVNKRYEVEQA